MQFVCRELKGLTFGRNFRIVGCCCIRIVGCCCRLSFLRLRSASTYSSGFLLWELFGIIVRADMVREMTDPDAEFAGEFLQTGHTRGRMYAHFGAAMPLGQDK